MWANFGGIGISKKLSNFAVIQIVKAASPIATAKTPAAIHLALKKKKNSCEKSRSVRNLYDDLKLKAKTPTG